MQTCLLILCIFLSYFHLCRVRPPLYVLYLCFWFSLRKKITILASLQRRIIRLIGHFTRPKRQKRSDRNKHRIQQNKGVYTRKFRKWTDNSTKTRSLRNRKTGNYRLKVVFFFSRPKPIEPAIDTKLLRLVRMRLQTQIGSKRRGSFHKHVGKERKKWVRNLFLSVPFRKRTIAAYGPFWNERDKTGSDQVSFTRKNYSVPFYFLTEPFHCFRSCKGVFRLF